MSKKAKVGRPSANINLPAGKFTFADFVAANSHVTPLTLRKYIAKDKRKGGKSKITLLRDETCAPNSDKGLGRKGFVYQLRNKADATPVKAVVEVSVDVATPTPTPSPEPVTA